MKRNGKPTLHIARTAFLEGRSNDQFANVAHSSCTVQGNATRLTSTMSVGTVLGYSPVGIHMYVCQTSMYVYHMMHVYHMMPELKLTKQVTYIQ